MPRMLLKRFPPKWLPVRRKKTRQIENRERASHFMKWDRAFAIVVSSAFLWTGVAVRAEPTEPAQASLPQTTADTGNKAPLPPGPARIKTAQGLEDDDLGMGVIIASWAAAVAVAFLVAFSGDDDDDESTPTTGTN